MYLSVYYLFPLSITTECMGDLALRDHSLSWNDKVNTDSKTRKRGPALISLLSDIYNTFSLIFSFQVAEWESLDLSRYNLQ